MLQNFWIYVKIKIIMPPIYMEIWSPRINNENFPNVHVVVLLCKGSWSNLACISVMIFKGPTKVCSDFQNSSAIWTHWWGPWPSTAAWPTSFATFAKDCVGCASMPICCSGGPHLQHHHPSLYLYQSTNGHWWNSTHLGKFSLLMFVFTLLLISVKNRSYCKWTLQLESSMFYYLVIFQYFICISQIPPFFCAWYNDTVPTILL